MKFLKFSIFILCLSFYSFLTFSQNLKQAPKYIFLFIGDGMGINQVSLAEASRSDSIGFSHLCFSNFPAFALVESNCKNNLITDSGAAASAIACGKKENFENISYFENDTSVKSIAKILKEKDYKIAIITTSYMNDATPSAFYASNQSRKNYYDIALEATSSNFDFFAGGGFKYPQGKNKDKKNIYDIFKSNNYDSISDLSKINKEKEKIIFLNPDLLYNGEMPYCIDNENYKRYALAEITNSAIDFLDNENGFFMMIEAGKIDWACHENDAATMLKEIFDFNDAVASAYNFYLEHKDETLIIVTADHETGGLSLGNAKNKYNSSFFNIEKQKISRELLEKKINELEKNNSIFSFDSLLDFMQFSFLDTVLIFNEDEILELKQAYNIFTGVDTITSKSQVYDLYGGYNPLSIAMMKIFNNRLAISFTSWTHTAAKLPIWAIGLGANKFSGTINNSDIVPSILDLFQ